MSIEEREDSCYEICPYCDAHFGDCDENLTQNPTVQECFNCGKKYKAWAEYTSTYYTESLEEEP